MTRQVWAIVTGASSGIGREFACVLAEHGVNLVLAARSKDVVEALARDLTKKYQTNNLIFAGDLAKQKQAKGLVEFIKNQKITPEYLINNAGFGDFGYFTETDWNKEEMMIDLNIKTLTYLSKIYAREMKKQGHGKIVNVASGAAFQPGPLMATYFASKAYVLHFSEAIAEELCDTGVTITALCPGPTVSNFWTVANKPHIIRFFPGATPTSQQVAQYGYKSMMRGERVAIYGFTNKLAALLVRFVPRNLITKIIMHGQQS